MKKIAMLVLSITLTLSVSIPTFAKSNSKNEIQTLVNKVTKEQKNVSTIIDNVNQSIVAIIGTNKNAKQNDSLYSKLPTNLQHGSGVIMDTEGRIITNSHVVEGIKDIYVVTYDGKAYKAKLLYANKEIDLAYLKIERTDLKPIKLGTKDNIRVGNDVIAIGTPLSFGYRNSASKGIVSGLNRPVDKHYNYLQTDASINPGNSGGPLVNTNGELVGINTLSLSFSQGMNFAIPVDNIKYFLNQYKKFGKIRKCYTGIELEENWAALLGIPTNEGLKVVTLQKNAILDTSRIKISDMLIKIDDTKISSIAEYNEVLKNHLPGDKITMTFKRDNKEFTVNVVLKEEPNSSRTKEE